MLTKWAIFVNKRKGFLQNRKKDINFLGQLWYKETDATIALTGNK